MVGSLLVSVICFIVSQNGFDGCNMFEQSIGYVPWISAEPVVLAPGWGKRKLY